MELYSLRLNGFRRFRDAKLNLQGPAIAVLGPNEVGKSTLFEALRYFNTDAAIAPTALSRETSPLGRKDVPGTQSANCLRCRAASRSLA